MSDGIPVYIDKHGIVWTNNEDLKPNGEALTNDQLEQLKREYFEAGHNAKIREEYNRALLQSGLVNAAGRYQTVEEAFESYEATKKDGEG